MDINKIDENDLRFLLKDKYNGLKTPNFYEDLKLLEQGYPLAYIIGYVDFLNTKIDLRYKPLIPRPETEYWVEKAIEEIKENHKNSKPLKILDIFCGSGCIGTALLKEIPNCKAVFADISENALKRTEYNLKLNKIDLSRYEIMQSDLFQNLNQFRKNKFDYIFANPPYVSQNDKFDESLKYEPRKALFAKKDGMEIIEKFLKESPQYLQEDGLIYLEFESKQKGLLEKSVINADFREDQFAKWRWMKLRNKFLKSVSY